MNNLLSYCGLVDAKILASDKDLPVRSSDISGTLDSQIDVYTRLFGSIEYLLKDTNFRCCDTAASLLLLGNSLGIKERAFF